MYISKELYCSVQPLCPRLSPCSQVVSLQARYRMCFGHHMHPTNMISSGSHVHTIAQGERCLKRFILLIFFLQTFR